MVDLQLYPLEIIKYAAYLISDKADVELISGEKGMVKAIITPFASPSLDDIKKLWNRSLIKASVDNASFAAAAPIRNLLAESVISITSDTRKTVEELTSQISKQVAQNRTSTNEQSESKIRKSLQDGIISHVDKYENSLQIKIDTGDILLPDLFWVLNAISDQVEAKVSYDPGIGTSVQLIPCDNEIDFTSLEQKFMTLLEKRMKQLRVGSKITWLSVGKMSSLL